MKIKNAGRGIHLREIPGIDRLRDLPGDWYAYSNLELYLGPGRTRENDVFLVIDDRILLVDLKDWHGKIETENGHWFLNNRDLGKSPVEKVRENARKLAEVMRSYLEAEEKKAGIRTPRVFVPFIQGCVVMTGTASLARISANERPSVVLLDDFMKKLPTTKLRAELLGHPEAIDRNRSLTEANGYWRKALGTFFNVQTGPFRPRQRLYGNYHAQSDDATYEHGQSAADDGIYREYDAEEDAPGRAPGLLRIWDFSRAATRFQTEEGRREVAGRERDVIAFLKDRNPDFDSAVLQPKDADNNYSVNYWEVFERRRQLRRLRDVNLSVPEALSDESRIDLAKGLLSKVKAMHELDASHLDIGAHSVWIEAPSTVKLSHLLAASYPTLKSLGEHRYQFLAAGWKFPEDHLGDVSDNKRRDVFLLGAAVHCLLFGEMPKPSGQNNPPDWNAGIDASDRFNNLHSWFAKALSWDVNIRFADAGSALEALNAATRRAHDGAQVLERLDRFRVWKDQLDLFESFPQSEVLKRSERVVIWRSVLNDESVVVKVWKRSSWGDDRLESPRILSFLEQAENLKAAQPVGLVEIHQVGFLGDSIALVSRYAAGFTLEKDQAENPGDWQDPVLVISFLRDLVMIVTNLHEAGFAHGDLKPANIVVNWQVDGTVKAILIDTLEFASLNDGEVVTTAYSPPTNGGRFERDRYATTKIVEEIIAKAPLEAEVLMRLASAIQTCRTGPPENGTLLPLLDAINSELLPTPLSAPIYDIMLPSGQAGTLLADEGSYAVRMRNDQVILRGASEELELDHQNGRFISARRRMVEQGHIARISKFEQFDIPGELDIKIGPTFDLRSLEFVLERVQELSTSAASIIAEPPNGADELEALDDDQGSDDVAEAVLIEPAAENVNIPRLWRSLIDTERELLTEGVAAGDSVYRAAQRRHILPFELERGSFEFSRLDRVLVERPRPNGAGWIDVGILDTAASSQGALFVDTSSRTMYPGQGPIIRDGDRLRFRSLLETESQTRRESATTRILSRHSIVPNLIDYFDPSASTMKSVETRDDFFDAALTAEQYGLNSDQVNAFSAILKSAPLGLLQGPPGTGKTKFIASFVHRMLTSGRIRNVLLASQSHEAVNNATEEVMALYRASNQELSLVRVGQEGQVSQELWPFHVDRVEGQFKDRFRNELRERLLILGVKLGLERALISDLTHLETVVRPVFETIRNLRSDPELPSERIAALLETAGALLQKIDLSVVLPDSWADDEPYQNLITLVGKRHSASPDKVRRFLNLTKLSRDWLGSVSTRQRSFETFLAGTRSIVAGTCVGLGRSALGLTQTRFDLVVIDEAARCTASELAVPMQSGRWIVLVGDQKQLEPHHRPDVVNEVARQTGTSRSEILKSDFERVFSSGYGALAGITLTQQYRMLPPIGRVVSKSFYDGLLQHARDEPRIPLGVLPRSLQFPLTWVSTDALASDGYQKRSGNGRSLINESEVDAILTILRSCDEHELFRDWLSSQSELEKPIGIICSYAAQRDAIRRRLPAAGLSSLLRESCKVETVDSYQGKQNPIVILSLVRNNAEGFIENGRPTIKAGFMGRPNRINVALSRSMDRIVLVGALDAWQRESPMQRVASAFREELVSGNAEIVEAEGRRSGKVGRARR